VLPIRDGRVSALWEGTIRFPLYNEISLIAVFGLFLPAGGLGRDFVFGLKFFGVSPFREIYLLRYEVVVHGSPEVDPPSSPLSETQSPVLMIFLHLPLGCAAAYPVSPW